MTNEDIKKRLEKLLYEKVHHTSEWDKIPSVTEDYKYKYLDWHYDDKEIRVKSDDYNLIALIEEAIKIYLEETED